MWPGILLTEPGWVSHWKSLQKKPSPEKFVLTFWLGTCDVSYVIRKLLDLNFFCTLRIQLMFQALKENVSDYCSNYDQFHNSNSKSTKYRLAVAQANSVCCNFF